MKIKFKLKIRQRGWGWKNFVLLKGLQLKEIYI